MLIKVQISEHNSFKQRLLLYNQNKKITAFTVCEGSFYLIWFFDQIDQNGVMQISVDFWC